MQTVVIYVYIIIIIITIINTIIIINIIIICQQFSNQVSLEAVREIAIKCVDVFF